MKKVCHVTSVHSRYDIRIFKKECVSLANNGYDVTLFCIDDKESEVRDNVNITSKNYKYKNRFERILKSSKNIKRDLTKIDAEVYHLHDPELIDLIPFLKKHNKKVIFDSHEDYPDLILEKTWIKKPLRLIISKIYEIKEKQYLKLCDAVISVTPHICNRLKKINKKTYMITNYPIIDKLPKKNNFDNYICFAGGITPQWSHENIVSSLKDINIEYKLAGKVTDDYKEKLNSLNYKSLSFLGKLSYGEVLNLYKNASIGMALCQKSKNVDGDNGSLGNTKLFEYMASGVPIICTNFKLWKEILNEYPAGICVNPNNVEEIRDAILTIMKDDKLKQKMGNAGMRAVKEKYNWKTQEEILLKIYKSV